MKQPAEITLQDLLSHPEKLIRLQAQAILKDLEELQNDETYPNRFARLEKEKHSTESSRSA